MPHLFRRTRRCGAMLRVLRRALLALALGQPGPLVAAQESVPSSQEGAQVKESDKEAFRSTLPSYGKTGIGRQ